MKLTNEDIIMAREPLKCLAELKLPVMVSYKLAKLINKGTIFVKNKKVWRA